MIIPSVRSLRCSRSTSLLLSVRASQLLKNQAWDCDAAAHNRKRPSRKLDAELDDGSVL